MILNPWVILGSLVVVLGLVTGAWFLGDNHGTFVERAAQTAQQLSNANKTIGDIKAENKLSAKAGEEHDVHSTQVTVDTSAIGRALRDALAKIPPSADPLVPIWFVRMFDRAASRYVGADPLPGQSDGDTSTVRLSVVGSVLTTDFGRAETCRVQLTDLIAYAKDANAKREKIEPKSLLDRLGL